MDQETTSQTGHLAGEERVGSENRLICQSKIGCIEMAEDQRMMSDTGSLAGRRRIGLIVRLVGQETNDLTVRLMGRGRTGCVGYRV